MTPAELRYEIIKIGAEMCRYPDCTGVYIKREIVNSKTCEWAVRLKRLADTFCPPGGKQ